MHRAPGPTHRTLMVGLAGLVALLIAACAPAAPSPTAAPAQPAAPAPKPAATTAPAQAAAPAAPGKALDFKLATTTAGDSVQVTALKKFADALAKATNDQIKVTIYPNGQLGGSSPAMEGTRSGAIDMGLHASGILSNFVPEMKAFDLPYLFKDRAHVARFLKSDLVKDWDALAQQKGFKILSYTENGFRDVTNNKRPIKSVADMKSLKLRTIENKTYIATFKAMGSNVVPLDIKELYTALQTGAVDGQENAITVVSSQKFYEVQKYMTLSHHIYGSFALTINKARWDSLSPEQQQIMQKLAIEAGDEAVRLAERADDGDLAFMESKGVQVTRTINYEEWKSSVKPVYDEFGAEVGPAIIQKIQALAP